ncbi:MAG: ROK family protein [Polaromonas sp.]|uniref:ROK family protein n=1 Tax=Polaromonas sp. TaxID=1869339 RepID=UPI0027321F84|nr:ROK family protein [Polaromonas sp.]MDP1742736.1 ROK family protein [Polaromonas sp.]MDP1956540.1 ROK family protein [Polaromonas sp.]MDP3354613.1 ROK family protein [Polaromonas sp.]MDP3751678.1 ROK family protein [Polaromonas sp.]
MTDNAPVNAAPNICLPPGAAPIACVDIGGTKVAVSLVDAHGIRGRIVEPTVKTGESDALSRQVIRMLDESCAQAQIKRERIAAVGIASCGPFVMSKGLVELAAPNICGGLAGAARGLPNNWTSALLEAPLRDVFADVRIENDGIAALQAERRWGALQGMDHCAYVTWSTGIGVGLCVDGRPLRGKNGNAGHAGHMFVSDNSDALCGCGNIGDVEALVAGNALPRRFSSLGYPDTASILTAARAGESRAQAIVDDACRILGRALYNLVVTLDLQRISLGGSVFWHHRDYLLPRLQEHISGKLPALTDGFALRPAGLGDRVGDYAALALVA